MADEVTLDFLAQQQRQLLDELRAMRGDRQTLRDDMNVLAAIVQRVDTTMGLLLAEMRAVHAAMNGFNMRISKLESAAP